LKVPAYRSVLRARDLLFGDAIALVPSDGIPPVAEAWKRFQRAVPLCRTEGEGAARTPVRGGRGFLSNEGVSLFILQAVFATVLG
jgi:hypothetical protein